jgi:heme exporter protein D
MSWTSLSEFAAMGGYAGYVWGSYGVTLFVLAAELVAVRRRRRIALAELRRFCEAERRVR